MTSRNSEGFHEWFRTRFDLYSSVDSLKYRRAGFEFASIYEMVSDEDSSQVELIQQAKARYVLALEAILDDDKVQVEDLEELGLQARLDRILTQLQSIRSLERENTWLQEETAAFKSELTTQSTELQELIRKEEELSQESHQQEVLLAEKALEEARIQRQQEQAQMDAEVQDAIIVIREEIQEIAVKIRQLNLDPRANRVLRYRTSAT